MSIIKNELSKSFDGFTSDIIQKTNLFFKSFKELTQENIENYLDCLGLLDIWNSDEEKQFLWNTFYKYNINGKVVESSVLKGMQEILSKEELERDSIISGTQKKEDYSRDNNINIIRLSFNRINSSNIFFSSSEEEFIEGKKENGISKNLDELKKYIDNCDIKKLKTIRNIIILLNYNSFDENNFSIKLSQINNVLEKYVILKIDLQVFVKYISYISESSSKINKDEEEYIINKNLYNISIKTIENKIKEFESKTEFNENINIKDSNKSLSDSNLSNNIEGKFKDYYDSILNINNEMKVEINILKDIENSIKNCYQNIINNFKNLLSMKNFDSTNENINKITDKYDNEDELKICIENNISYLHRKYEEIDIFLLDIENNIIQNYIKNKNLNILIDRIIEKINNLQNEKNILLANKKQIEQDINIDFNRADEQINKLIKEKNELKSKISDLLEEIENLKLNDKHNKEKIMELENDKIANTKEIENKSIEINKLKLEIKNFKNKYDTLLNELIQINNKKEDLLKNYENQLIKKALDNITKKIQNKYLNKNLFNCDIEQLLEMYFKLEENNNIKTAALEEKENLIIAKNKKINQLEIDLDLYREKTQILLKENKKLQDTTDNIENKNIKIESDRKTFTLEDLNKKNSSNLQEDNKNDKDNFTIFKNENYIINNNEEKPLLSTNSGNLFAPPCFVNNENNINSINDLNNNQKLFSNEIEETKGENEEKKFINTPFEDDIRNSINDISRPSNPYLPDNKDEINANIDNKKELFKINDENSLINSIENLNINKEFIKNNEANKHNLNGYVIETNNILKQNVEKSITLKEMNDIILNNYENKLSISSYDYLHLFTNEKIKQIFSKIGEDYKMSEIFSDIIYLLDKYEQFYKNIIFITNKGIYIIEPNTYKIKYTFVRSILIKFTLSSINCNIIVLHFLEANDLVIMTLRRPDLISFFIKTDANCKKENIKNKPDITFKYADEFNIKKDGEYYTQKIKSSMKSTAFNFQTAIKLGYLYKINEGYVFTQYHEKLVALTEFGLFYFENPIVAPKRLVSIIGAKIIDLKNKFEEKLFCFEIITMNNYKIVFGTYCKEEYEEWLQILNETKKKYENKNV